MVVLWYSRAYRHRESWRGEGEGERESERKDWSGREAERESSNKPLSLSRGKTMDPIGLGGGERCCLPMMPWEGERMNIDFP